MQALSKSGDSIRLEFIVIVDLVKNIAQLLNDTIEAATVSIEESERQIFCTPHKKKKEQQNMNKIAKATSENSVEIKKIYTANCTIRR